MFGVRKRGNETRMKTKEKNEYGNMARVPWEIDIWKEEQAYSDKVKPSTYVLECQGFWGGWDEELGVLEELRVLVTGCPHCMIPAASKWKWFRVASFSPNRVELASDNPGLFIATFEHLRNCSHYQDQCCDACDLGDLQRQAAQTGQRRASRVGRPVRKASRRSGCPRQAAPARLHPQVHPTRHQPCQP